MKWRDSPQGVAQAADMIFVMVTGSKALEAVAEGSDGFLAGLRSGTIVIDMSTVSPAVSRAAAEKVRAQGADMVDAPVSGSVSTCSTAARSW
jgi:3-hydroxyisobutyrate dehydrogenase-like beta-hydroxyacid dehydrogenase